MSASVPKDDARFPFGKNWASFLRVLDDQRIDEAQRSLVGALGTKGIRGKSFLDIGSGSGLFSLAAQRLGAARVHSFDYDPESVACTAELRRRFAADAPNWSVERGDALDDAYLDGLGEWEIVYSWGVLHHTGDLWRALDKVSRLVSADGVLFIAIYNDQGTKSRLWRMVKLAFNRNALLRIFIKTVFVSYWVSRGLLADLLRLRNPLARYRAYKKTRGMSLVHDWIDWLGGYPFEVARPEAIFRFFRDRGFALREMVTRDGLACNEFVFARQKAGSAL